MNKQQFLERRAKMHFEKTHGITVCPKDKAGGIDETPSTVKRRHRHNFGQTIARRITMHHTDESGESVPITINFKQ